MENKKIMLKKFVNWKLLAEQLRNPKFHEQDKFYQPTNLTYGKIDVPLQTLCKMRHSHSLNKFIDSPARETMWNSSTIEEEPEEEIREWLEYNNDQCGISQESTSEDGAHHPHNTMLARKMSIKSSAIFTDCKATNYENFWKEYGTVKNKLSQDKNMDSRKKTQSNFSVKKVESKQILNATAESTNNQMFENFDKEVSSFFNENHDSALDEQPIVLKPKYGMRSSRSK